MIRGSPRARRKAFAPIVEAPLRASEGKVVVVSGTLVLNGAECVPALRAAVVSVVNDERLVAYYRADDVALAIGDELVMLRDEFLVAVGSHESAPADEDGVGLQLRVLCAGDAVLARGALTRDGGASRHYRSTAGRWRLRGVGAWDTIEVAYPDAPAAIDEDLGSQLLAQVHADIAEAKARTQGRRSAASAARPPVAPPLRSGVAPNIAALVHRRRERG